MMTKTQRQLAFLGALLVALVAVLVLRGDDGPAETPAVPSNREGRAGAPAREVAVTDVKLELLQADREGLSDPERNPFRFEQKAPPPAPPVAARSNPGREFAPPPPFVPAGPPPPPPIPLRFIGVIAAEGRPRVAQFSDGKGNVFQGSEGAIIEGRYRVQRIGPESVELAYLDGRGRQTIRLSGQ
jgi:hypothetical protein